MTDDDDLQRDELFLRARQQLLDNDYNAACRSFSDLVLRRPEAEGVYGNRGLCQLMLGNDYAAVEDFRRVIELQPNDVMGHVCLSEALCNLERFSEAWNHLAKAFSLSDCCPEAYYLRAWFFARGRQFEQAISDLEYFLFLSSENDEAQDFLDACKSIVQNFSDYQSDEVDDFLASALFSFDCAPRKNAIEEGRYCDYSHCIRTRPIRCRDAPTCCIYYGKDCPAGAEAASKCRLKESADIITTAGYTGFPE